MVAVAAVAALVAACGGDDRTGADAGMDAMRRLALTVDGTPALQPITRSVKVSITAGGFTSKETFAVSGLPSTVDLAQPVSLATWDVDVEGYDAGGQLVGRGSAALPSRTTEATVSLAPP